MKIGSLVMMSQKELLDLLVEEKRASYRKGYKAGAAMRYRHVPATTEATTVATMPAVYGDSLPVQESLTSKQ
ncbi:MAG: hypothetical protein WCY09_08275 [Candidatus Omnitrophota bacterium]